MKVFFLGTGGAEGFPAIFSDTPINQEARRRGGKDLRTRSTILVDETIKIDLPPDTLAHVLRYPDFHPARLEHLLFTHSHDDHFAVRELQYLSPNFAPDRRLPLQVYATDEVIRRMYGEMAHFFEPSPLLFHAVVPFKELPVGHLHVTPLLANHKHDELCLNYIVRSGDTRLLYATDTGWYGSATWDFLFGYPLDAVVVECGKGISDNPYPGHLSLDESIRFKDKLVAGGGLSSEAPFLLTHISHTGMLLHDDLSEHCNPFGILVAYDGLELIL
jgi:phosphoribosyl 1,2-cyclic phosphate phosphodiesterase